MCNKLHTLQCSFAVSAGTPRSLVISAGTPALFCRFGWNAHVPCHFDRAQRAEKSGLERQSSYDCEPDFSTPLGMTKAGGLLKNRVTSHWKAALVSSGHRPQSDAATGQAKSRRDASKIVMIFDVNANVLPIGVGIVGDSFVQPVQGPEDLDGGHSAANPGYNEYDGEKDGEQISEDVDQKAETDQQQSDDEQSGGEVSRRLGNDICVKAEAHGCFQTLIKKYKKITNIERRVSNIERFEAETASRHASVRHSTFIIRYSLFIVRYFLVHSATWRPCGGRLLLFGNFADHRIRR
jgi:hypothetical protein